MRERLMDEVRRRAALSMQYEREVREEIERNPEKSEEIARNLYVTFMQEMQKTEKWYRRIREDCDRIDLAYDIGLIAKKLTAAKEGLERKNVSAAVRSLAEACPDMEDLGQKIARIIASQ